MNGFVNSLSTFKNKLYRQIAGAKKYHETNFEVVV